MRATVEGEAGRYALSTVVLQPGGGNIHRGGEENAASDALASKFDEHLHASGTTGKMHVLYKSKSQTTTKLCLLG